MKSKQRPSRAYRMTVRAEAQAATHQRVLEATIALMGTRLYDEVSLADVARAADVTVQTVLRRFGSKEGLAEAATALGLAEVRRARQTSPSADVAAIVQNLLEHYEAWGDRSLRFLGQEERTPAMRRITDAGRALHAEWVEQAFAPWLAAKRKPARERLRARLRVVTDVFAWKILRRDLRLDPRATEKSMRELVVAVLA